MFKFAEAKDGVLDATREAGGRKLTLRVRNLRLDRDGSPRGVVGMIVDSTPVWSGRMDLDDAGDRHQFALALYGTLTTNGKGRHPTFGPEVVTALPQPIFEQELMLWSRAAWNAYIGPSSGSLVCGDESPSAPPWAVPGLVMEGSTCIWAGDAGANKSTLMRLTCQSLNYGTDTVIPIVQKAPCIWVNAEEAEQEHTRQLGNINAALGLPRTAGMFTIHARGMRIEDLATRLAKAVREQQARHIFIDSLSRLAQGSNLNDNNTATLLIDSVSGLGCSVTWIGHTGWENRSRLAGSRHFENAARVMVLVQSRQWNGLGPDAELTRGVRARVTKANGAVPTAPMYWTLTYHRQYGVAAAGKAYAEDWPMLSCGAFLGEGKLCGRLTWDGVMPNLDVRCPRHRDEEGEP